jgi:hypothetical protein
MKMNYKVRSITINQTLHGYDGGHTLLASSLSLSADDERFMMFLSDMSGPSMTKGFETYITGYHLINEPAYVIAKTWYANEMERPGCVWTHSLIINDNDLSMILQPQILVTYFRRPENFYESVDYSKTIITKQGEWDQFITNRRNIPRDEFKNILFSIYEYSQRQIFIPAQNSEIYEDIILNLWEFQWADLRKKFAFCTGSIENRSNSELTFDVQVIPERNREKVERKCLEGLFIRPGSEQEQKEGYPNWVNFIFEQIYLKENSSKLIEKLNIWGKDISHGRKSFSSLLEVYIQLNNNQNLHYEDINNIVDLISRDFPQNDDAVSLKESLLGEKGNDLVNGGSLYQEEDILRALCTTKKYSAFNSDSLRIKQRSKDLFSKNPDKGIEILEDIVSANPNPLGEDYILGLSDISNLESLKFYLTRKESLLQIFLYNNPLIGLDSDIWNTSEDKQKEILNAVLSSPKLNNKGLYKVITFLLSRKHDYLAGELFAHIGDKTVFPLLSWIDSNIKDNNFELGNEWKNQLAYRSGLIIDWLLDKRIKIQSYKTLAFLSQLLSPNSKDVLNCGAGFWLNFLKQSECIITLNEIEKIRIHSFFLGISFYLDEPDASEILARSFLIVHNAARDEKLPYECWEKISGKLPELSWFKSWDKCERLRRGLINLFIYKHWMPMYFFIATNQEDVFERIIKYSMEHKETRKYIKKIFNEIPSLNQYVSTFQSKIIRKYYNL